MLNKSPIFYYDNIVCNELNNNIVDLLSLFKKFNIFDFIGE